MSPAEQQEPEQPGYGPRGYVPPRAGQRARKIVLREPMGLGWPIAALVAGGLLAVLGAVYLLTGTGPPGPPFEPLAQLGEIDPRGATVLPAETGEVVVVRAGGGVRAFTAPGGEVAYCGTSRHLEGDGGEVWALDGRLLGGTGPSLARLPVEVHDGVVYVNPTDPGTPAPPSSGAEPAC